MDRKELTRNGQMVAEKKKNITLSSRTAKVYTRLHMHIFLQEHFVGPELFSNVISR